MALEDPVTQYDFLNSTGSHDPERTLMAAVLRQAIEDIHKYINSQNSERMKLFMEAKEWFEEKSNGHLFSFDIVCETLDLNPSYIKKHIQKYILEHAEKDWLCSLDAVLARGKRRKKRSINKAA